MSKSKRPKQLRTTPEQVLFVWPGEEWRPIADYDGYFVSSYGRVCSVDRIVMRSNDAPQFCRGRLLRPGSQQSGHLTVSLTRYNSKSVHVLVLETFVGPCPDGCEGLHRDDNPTHNAVPNLRWGTRSDNLNDAIRNGKKPTGERVYNSKLTDESVRFIRANPHMGLTELARIFLVHENAIRQVREFITWKHVA